MTPNIEEYKRFHEIMDKEDCFLIITHVKPDGDTIGSALAIAQILKRNNKNYRIVNEDGIPNKFFYLPLANTIVKPSELSKKYKNIITVDCADYSRIGTQTITLLDNDRTIINIDHHPSNDNFGEINIVDPNAASTTVVIYNICRDLGISFDYNVALCLYTGIMTDTGSFQHSNTTAEVFIIASKLLQYGINANAVANKIFDTMSLESIDIIKNSLETLVVDDSGKIAWLEIVTKEDQINNNTDGLINYPKSIEGVEVAVSFTVVNSETVKVGLRSKKNVDVSQIALFFGGGGHVKAAGCTINGTLEEAKVAIITEIKKILSN